MCTNPAVYHRVFSASGRCVICKDDVDEIYSTTCGHVCCLDCTKNIINNYNFIK